MKKVFKVTDKLSAAAGWISMALIVFSLVYLVLYVIARVVFGQAFKGGNEIIEVVMCMICFTAYAFTQVRRRHIQVGFVIIHLPAKVRYALSTFNCFWCMLLTGVLTYACFAQGAYAVQANKLSFVLKIPYAPFYYACGALMVLFVLAYFNDTIKSVMALCGDEEMQQDIAKGWI